jgi:adenine-specific DNA glycosylase
MKKAGTRMQIERTKQGKKVECVSELVRARQCVSAREGKKEDYHDRRKKARTKERSTLVSLVSIGFLAFAFSRALASLLLNGLWSFLLLFLEKYRLAKENRKSHKRTKFSNLA